MEQHRLHGIGVTQGVAVGTAVCVSNHIGDILQIPLGEEEIDKEIQRFRKAVEQTRSDIEGLRDRVQTEISEEISRIFDAQGLFLTDPSFLGRVEEHITGERVNAEWALKETMTEIQQRFDQIDSQHLRERSEDLRHVCRYVVRHLRGLDLHHISEVATDVVIVADDLSPSDAVRLGRENVAGFVIEHGSRTSHTTIIARSLNIPAVLGVHGAQALLADQSEVPVVVDGSQGVVVLAPTAETLSDYEEKSRLLAQREKQLQIDSELPALSRDDVRIQVMANIDLPEEIQEAQRFGAAGIGLYRSEFLYIEKSPELPTEDEHVEIYRQIVETAAPNPGIIRTYDLGGRKIAREVMDTQEENPVLGLRGIRLTMARQDIFKTQVRALLRATVYGDLWIMIPLVTIVEEVHAFRRFVEEMMAELEAEGLEFRRDFKLGVMIEVPAAAMISDLLAREVDFFSIGTNDLIQYALAVDRNNEHVADLYRPRHPGLLRLLRQVIRSARQEGIEVSLCGEMAADPEMTPILLGCGLRRLSVSPRQVPAIKRRIRALDVGMLDEVVETCCQLGTKAEIDAYLKKALQHELETASDYPS